MFFPSHRYPVEKENLINNDVRSQTWYDLDQYPFETQHGYRATREKQFGIKIKF